MHTEWRKQGRFNRCVFSSLENVADCVILYK
ncbi:hypothetical protein C7433_105133 [Pantoea sp. PNA 03-3]|nr:hypothetical protein C7433_105133 [Pantoea sp. PNA 03-3]